MDPPPYPVPDWLPTIMYSQYFFAFSLAVAGACHAASRGVFSRLYTGIYVGLIIACTTYFQKWILSRTSPTSGRGTYSRNQLRACQFLSAVALILSSIDLPIVALFSIAYGDAFGKPEVDEGGYCFMCVEYGLRAANLPAVICDGGLLVFGIIESLLICASGSYFWTLIVDDRFLFWWMNTKKNNYEPARSA